MTRGTTISSLSKLHIQSGDVTGRKASWLRIGLQSQRLECGRGRAIICEYQVSTARLGAGEENGSQMTPRGMHVVRARIGAGLPLGAVLVGRRPTGEIWSPQLMRSQPDRDWILSRILWLSGTEVGHNRFLRLSHRDGARRPFCHGLDNLFRAPQILLPDDLGFSVDPFTFPGVVVGLAPDHFLRNARHDVGHTILREHCQEKSPDDLIYTEIIGSQISTMGRQDGHYL